MSRHDYWNADEHGADPLDDASTVEPTEAATEPTEPAAPATPAAPEPAASEPAADPAPAPGAEAGTPTGDAQPAPAAPADPAAPAAPAPADVNWQQRFEDTRRLQVATATERNAAAERAERAETALNTLREQVTAYLQHAERQRTTQPAPQQMPEPSQAQLDEWGMTREAYQFVMNQAVQAAASRYEPVIAQLSQGQQQVVDQMRQAEAQRAQSAAQAQTEGERQRAIATFQAFAAQHPEFAYESGQRYTDLSGLIDRWNLAWSQIDGNTFDLGDPAQYEIAREALDRPVLAEILELQPHLFDSDRGLQMARDQATALEAVRGLASQPATATGAPNAAAVNAALAAAHTEPGSSGPLTGQPAQGRDEFDDVLDEYRSSGGGVFSGTSHI